MRLSTLVFVGVTLLSVSCAKARFKKGDEATAQAVMNCSVAYLENGDAEITCPDGTSATIRQGQNGADGINGTNGIDGTNGVDGADGVSCSVVEEMNGQGAMITCGSTAVLVKHGRDGVNGVNGQDGQDAPISAYQMVEVIDPCGSQSQFDEVLVRFANGDLMAHYANGKNQFLTLLRTGYNYVTTDGTSCQFSVNSQGTVTDSKGNSWKAP